VHVRLVRAEVQGEPAPPHRRQLVQEIVGGLGAQFGPATEDGDVGGEFVERQRRRRATSLTPIGWWVAISSITLSATRTDRFDKRELPPEWLLPKGPGAVQWSAARHRNDRVTVTPKVRTG
jgi:hypothetical protein